VADLEGGKKIDKEEIESLDGETVFPSNRLTKVKTNQKEQERKTRNIVQKSI